MGPLPLRSINLAFSGVGSGGTHVFRRGGVQICPLGGGGRLRTGPVIGVRTHSVGGGGEQTGPLHGRQGDLTEARRGVGSSPPPPTDRTRNPPYRSNRYPTIPTVRVRTPTPML